MGLFKSLRDLNKMGNAVAREHDFSAQINDAKNAMARMADDTALRTQGEPAHATIVALRDTGTFIQHAPVMEIDLTVFPADGGAFAALARTHGFASLASLQPGATVSVRFDPTRRDHVVIA